MASRRGLIMHVTSIQAKKGEAVRKIFVFIMAIAATAFFAVCINRLINPPAVACEAFSTVAWYGDTYWSLEHQANCTGGYDRQDRVYQIIEFNGGSSLLRQGQVVYFPQGK
jgi:hypothetical protein